VFLALGELLLSCNWAVVADILLVGVGRWGLGLGSLVSVQLKVGPLLLTAWGLGGVSVTMGSGAKATAVTSDQRPLTF
jgi:hypothetical protein